MDVATLIWDDQACTLSNDVTNASRMMVLAVSGDPMMLIDSSLFG